MLQPVANVSTSTSARKLTSPSDSFAACMTSASTWRSCNPQLEQRAPTSVSLEFRGLDFVQQ